MVIINFAVVVEISTYIHIGNVKRTPSIKPILDATNLSYALIITLMCCNNYY